MRTTSTFYLSRVLGRKAYSTSNIPIGRIGDILVSLEPGNPRVIALRVRTGTGPVLLDYAAISFTEENGQYVFRCADINQTLPEMPANAVFLKNNVLDRQLVDINGKKLVRVNDIRIAHMAAGTFVVAVDVGPEGILRRLGVAKPLKRLLQPFRIGIPSRLVLWDEVETIDFGDSNIKLSAAYSKLETLHASELADLIEGMDANVQAGVFASLSEERAADVLEEMEDGAQLSIIDRLPVDKMADVLERMPSDEAADVLEAVSEEKAEKLLSEMDSASSQEVRELLEYDEDEVGSLMSTDYLSFGQSLTVDEVISELRKAKPETDTIYYLYVVDEGQRLLATVSLRDLILAGPGTRLSDVMNRKIVYLHDTDKIDTVGEIVSKYSLLAVPVVDKDDVLSGVVIIDDIVYTLLKSNKRMRR